MDKNYKVVSSAVTFGKFNHEPVQRLLDLGFEVQLNPFGRPFTPAEFHEIAGDADAVIVGNDKVTESVIRQFTKIKVIAKHGVGIDGIDTVTAAELGITVTNAPGTNKEEVADSAMAFLLMMARDIEKMSRETKAGKWIKYPTSSMNNKTLGIIGAGDIGTAFAKRAAGFGMRLLVCDPIQRDEVRVLGAEYVGLDQLLEESDFVSIHCPLDLTTEKMLQKAEFEKMKSGVFLVNTARSQILDYDQLYPFVKSGHIAGYAADVFDFEPPVMHPLYKLSNVFLTPHVAGTTYDSNYRMGSTAVDNVIAVLQGETPPNKII